MAIQFYQLRTRIYQANINSLSVFLQIFALQVKIQLS